MDGRPKSLPLRFVAGLLYEPSVTWSVTRSGIMFAAMRGTQQIGLFKSEPEAWRALVIDARKRGRFVSQDVLQAIAAWMKREARG
jgi:hypothetical protein